jgi:citrate lyase synthetase
MGDIGRAADEGRDFVKINKNFTKLSGREYMRARKLFLENAKINALPVVDEENRLLGDYTRWDDHLAACEVVDYLIIFVVEESRSLFSFQERFAMVREGTRDLENVTVVPSGNFILSQLTFPEYFVKIEDEDLTDNAEYDITLFAEAIAPKLHITYRFVGEEREDEVTAAYNSAMKKILPEHGIQLVEIHRKKVADGDDTAISASLVRKRLEQESPEELRDLLPESTVRVLGMSWENWEKIQ